MGVCSVDICARARTYVRTRARVRISAHVRTYVRVRARACIYICTCDMQRIRDLDRKYSYSNSTSQRGKMASQADLLQEAERLIEKKDINAAIDLLNRLGTKFSAGVILLYKRS